MEAALKALGNAIRQEIKTDLDNLWHEMGKERTLRKSLELQLGLLSKFNYVSLEKDQTPTASASGAVPEPTKWPPSLPPPPAQAVFEQREEAASKKPQDVKRIADGEADLDSVNEGHLVCGDIWSDTSSVRSCLDPTDDDAEDEFKMLNCDELQGVRMAGALMACVQSASKASSTSPSTCKCNLNDEHSEGESFEKNIRAAKYTPPTPPRGDASIERTPVATHSLDDSIANDTCSDGSAMCGTSRRPDVIHQPDAPLRAVQKISFQKPARTRSDTKPARTAGSCPNSPRNTHAHERRQKLLSSVGQ